MSKEGANHHSQQTGNGTEGLVHKKEADKSRKGSWSSRIYKGQSPCFTEGSFCAQLTLPRGTVLKKKQKNTTISKRAMAVMESFSQDMFEKLSVEASKLAARNDREVITATDFAAA